MFRLYMAIIRFFLFPLRFRYINIYSETLRGKKTWWWSYKVETCCFISNLRIYIFYIRNELCFWLPSHLSSSPTQRGWRSLNSVWFFWNIFKIMNFHITRIYQLEIWGKLIMILKSKLYKLLKCCAESIKA